MNKSKYFLLTLLILVIMKPILATNIDSLKQLPTDSMMIWLTDQMNEINNEKEFTSVAYALLNQALDEKDYSLAASIHDRISFWNYINYEINGVDTVMYHREKQIEYDLKMGNLEGVGKGYLDLAIDYGNDSQYKKTSETLLKAIKIFESINDENRIAEANLTLAQLYMELNEPKKALYYAEQAYPTVIKEEDHILIGYFHEISYAAYLELEDYPKALASVNAAIKIFTDYDLNQGQASLVHCYGQKGDLYLVQNEFDLARSFFAKAWELSKTAFSEDVSETFRYNIGHVYYLQGKYQEALPHLLAGSSGYKTTIAFDNGKFNILSACYEQLGDYQNALKYRTQYFDLEGEFLEDKIANLESEALVKYETGKKDQELLEQAKIIQQKNWIQWLSIGALILLVGLLSSLFFFFRKNQKTNLLLLDKNNQIEERNKQYELLLKEVHHRVKNNLQTISSLLSLQSASITDQNALDAVEESKNRVASMGLIHQKLYQGDNLAVIEMKDYFQTIGSTIIESFGEKAATVELEVNMPEIELDVDTAIPIGLITNELVTNSLKYAFKESDGGKISIQLEKGADNLVQLVITDNGKFVDYHVEEKTRTGFGSLLVNLLTTQLDGAMEQSTTNGTVTKIQFTIPDKTAA